MRRTWCIIAIAIAALGACNRAVQKSEGRLAVDLIPGSARARVQSFAEHLPPNVEGALFVGSFARADEDVPALERTLEVFAPELAGELGALSLELGGSADWVSELDDKGIVSSTGAAVAQVSDALIFMTYVHHPRSFDAYMAQRFMPDLCEGAEVVEVPVRGRDVSSMSCTDSEFAWAYDGKMVVVGGRHVSEDPGRSRSIASVVGDLASMESSASLGSTERFGAFREVSEGDFSVALLLDPDALALSMSEDGVDPVLQWVLGEGAEYVGIAATSGEESVKARLFFGGAESSIGRVLSSTRGLPETSLGGFGTQGLIIGVHMSTRSDELWRAVSESATLQSLDTLPDLFAGLGIDFEEDVLSRSSGHFGAYLYGVHIPHLVQSASNPEAITDAFQFAFVMQFEDAGALAVLKERVSAALGGPPVSELKAPRGKIVELPERAGRLVFSGNLMVFATMAMDLGEVAKSLSSPSSATPLEAQIGTPLLTRAPNTSLYLDVGAMKSQLGPLVAGFLRRGNPFMNTFSEFGCVGGVKGSTVFVDLTFGLKPAP